MKYPCTGVILAGGLSTRFSGINKAFINVGGKKILDTIYDIFTELFDEIILVSNEPVQYLDWDMNIATDIFPVRSSLTGIHAGIFTASCDYAFITACDTPFLKKEIIETILENIDPRFDVIIPETSAGLEPLCAVYSKQCLKPMARNIVQEKFKIQSAFKSLRVKKIPERILTEKDPELTSFYNINTPEQLTVVSEQ